MQPNQTQINLDGLWSEGPYTLRSTNGEPLDAALKDLLDMRIPGRKELHGLASFLLVTAPSGVELDAHDGGEPWDDDSFYLAVLLQEEPMTFHKALEAGHVYAVFRGE